MAQDLETLLAKVKASMEESKAMILATRQMVESSRRHFLRPEPAKEEVDAGADWANQEEQGTSPTEPKTGSELIGDSPEKTSG